MRESEKQVHISLRKPMWDSVDIVNNGNDNGDRQHKYFRLNLNRL